MNLRFLPPGFRPTPGATTAGVLAGLLFVGLGLIACWDHSQWTAFVILGGTVGIGLVTAKALGRRLGR
jgi:hypothetical protein